MILTVKIEVGSKGEAYSVVSMLSFEHKVVEAEFGQKKEVFGPENPPVLFLRDNTKNKAKFRTDLYKRNSEKYAPTTNINKKRRI